MTPCTFTGCVDRGDVRLGHQSKLFSNNGLPQQYADIPKKPHGSSFLYSDEGRIASKFKTSIQPTKPWKVDNSRTLGLIQKPDTVTRNGYWIKFLDSTENSRLLADPASDLGRGEAKPPPSCPPAPISASAWHLGGTEQSCTPGRTRSNMKPLIRTGPSDGAMQVTFACTLHAGKIPMHIPISFQLNKRASFQTCNHRVCFSPSLFSIWRRPANSVLYYLFMQTLHCKRSQKS
ncbi:hypothetical protein Anapl_13742 [Anas platyrhynchos]|uniref:Uncharacterized protein n=1 Tax=Anas platyrhynchos TaxID=8839 RepID=R0KAF1_ANAPL|nr:hypothetical protein Anapl_13742 [Anas platyrhynchos]